MVRNCVTIPITKPTASSNLVCALKYNLEEAINPVNKINMLNDSARLISK